MRIYFVFKLVRFTAKYNDLCRFNFKTLIWRTTVMMLRCMLLVFVPCVPCVLAGIAHHDCIISLRGEFGPIKLFNPAIFFSLKCRYQAKKVGVHVCVLGVMYMCVRSHVYVLGVLYMCVRGHVYVC
jgi:hypothetical protein